MQPSDVAQAPCTIALTPDSISRLGVLVEQALEGGETVVLLEMPGAASARVATAVEPVREAIAICARRGARIRVAGFPRCLLGDDAARLDEVPSADVSRVVGCAWQLACVLGAPRGPCAGLPIEYVARHGWEERLLSPRFGGAPSESGATIWGPGPGESTADTALLGLLGLEPGAVLATMRVARGRRVGAGLRLDLVGADGARLRVELVARDESSRCFARSRSFNVVHEKLGSNSAEIAAALAALVAVLARRDRGGLGERLADGAPAQASIGLLRQLLSALPCYDDPYVQRILSRVLRRVAELGLPAHSVEPSIGLGEPGFRFIANAAPGRLADRRAVARRMLAAFDLNGADIATAVEGWLEEPEREVFLGAAIEPGVLRSKIYFGCGRRRDPEFGAPLARLGAPQLPLEGIHLACVDVVDGRPAAWKSYAAVSRTDAKSRYGGGLLVPLLGRLCGDDWTAVVSRRFDASGVELDESLHVQVERLDPSLGVELARALEDVAAADLIAGIQRRIPVRPRVLSESRSAPFRHRVYLSLAERES